MHQPPQRRPVHPSVAAPVTDVPVHVLQQIVDKRTHLRRLEPGAGALLRPQTVLHEIPEMAAFQPVDAGRGHGDAPPVQRLHRLRRQPAPAHGPGLLHPCQQRRLPVLREVPPQRPARLLPRQCQRRRRQLPPIAAVLPLDGHLRKDPGDAPHREGRQQLTARPVRHRPRHRQGRRGLGQTRIDVLQFRAEGIERGIGQQNAPLLQKRPLLRIQQAAPLLHRGQHIVVGPQQKEVPHRVPVVSGDGRHLHLIQRGGDGGHGVLAQHQPQEAGELLPVHLHVPQQLHELIQHTAEDAPQLPVLLRQLHLPVVIQRRRLPFQCLRDARRLGKPVKHFRFIPHRFTGFQSLAEIIKQPAYPAAHGVDLRQPLPPHLV